MGWSGNVIDFAIACRISYVNFYDLNSSTFYSPNMVLNNQVHSFQPQHYNSFFFEPAYTVHCGYKQLKFHLGCGLSIATTQISDQERNNNLSVLYQGIHINTGLTIDLAKRFER
jgi:hypothetical protein